MDKYVFDFSKILGYIIMIVLVIVFSKAMTNFVYESSDTDTTMIENSINSALMQCYALEGAYPADQYYLKEYGVWFNEDKYYYFYEYYDGGIMPVVKVISKPKI